MSLEAVAHAARALGHPLPFGAQVAEKHTDRRLTAPRARCELPEGVAADATGGEVVRGVERRARYGIADGEHRNPGRAELLPRESIDPWISMVLDIQVDPAGDGIFDIGQ